MNTLRKGSYHKLILLITFDSTEVLMSLSLPLPKRVSLTPNSSFTLSIFSFSNEIWILEGESKLVVYT